MLHLLTLWPWPLTFWPQKQLHSSRVWISVPSLSILTSFVLDLWQEMCLFALIDPVTLTFDLLTSKTYQLQGSWVWISVPSLSMLTSFVLDVWPETCFCTYWPCDLHLWPFDLENIPAPEFMSMNICAKCEHSNFIWARVMVRTNTHLHTRSHTDGNECPTCAASVRRK